MRVLSAIAIAASVAVSHGLGELDLASRSLQTSTSNSDTWTKSEECFESCPLSAKLVSESACRGRAGSAENAGQTVSLASSDLDALSATNMQVDVTVTIATHAETPNEPCCQMCTCYGDPECSSFNEVEKKWILCDARKRGRMTSTGSVECPVTKNLCVNMDDGTGNFCEWTPTNKFIVKSGVNRGGQVWKVSEKGSPCQPNLDAHDFKMMMIDQKDGSFTVELLLGERGIIGAVDVKIAGDPTLTIGADDCFDAQWQQDNARSYMSFASGATNDIMLVTFDTDDYYMSLSCIRERNNRYRINVNEVVIPSGQQDGTGFCHSDVIAEIPTVTAAQVDKHLHCTTQERNPLQACKQLVNLAALPAELPVCAQSFCESLDLTPLQKAECKTKMATKKRGSKGFERWTTWIEYYCTAIAKQNAGSVSGLKGVCTGAMSPRSTNVPENALHHFIAKYGKGKATPVDNGCIATLDAAVLPAGDTTSFMCETGVLVESRAKGSSDEFVPRMFFPESTCGTLSLDVPTDAGDDLAFLFTEEVRVTTHLPEVKSRQCLHVNMCAPTRKMEFEIDYADSVGRLTNALEECVQTRGEQACLECLKTPST